MKKLIIITMLVAFSGTLRAQTAGESLGRIDNAIESLATELTKQLDREGVQTVALGQFPYMGTSTQFNSYLNNQLTGELVNVRSKSFSLLSGGGTPEMVISGEIVRIEDVVRIYARLVRRDGNSIAAQTYKDLELNQSISALLSAVTGTGIVDGGLVMPDQWEVDSMDAPVAYDADSTSAAAASVMNRTIQQGGDEDWFLVSADDASQLILETTGNIDTYMTLFNADTHEELASNDDSRGSNAGIRYFAGAGSSYLVMVRGYSSDTTGDYGFRAYTEELGDPIRYEVSDDINEARFVMGRLEGNDNLYLLTPNANGTMVLETSGSNDVFMELYDADTYLQLAEDDDSGYDNNARITYQVERGKSYLARVRGFSNGTSGQYGFKSYLEHGTDMPVSPKFETPSLEI